MVTRSLPQHAYSGTAVLRNESKVAHQENVPMFELMESAGQSVFDFLQRHYCQQSMMIFCGKGNNGGDGFVVGYLALCHDINVEVILLAQEADLKGDARLAYQQYIDAGGTVTSCLSIEESQNLQFGKNNTIIVDAIFGIGFTGQLPELIASISRAIELSNLPVISIDIPSGIDASSGAVSPFAIEADATVSFIALKQGLLTGNATHNVGKLIFEPLSIGVVFCQHVESQCFVQWFNNLPSLGARHKNQHKGSLGLLLTIGGKAGMPGAIRLASEAALRCGAPLVAVASAQENHQAITANRYELMLAESSPELLSKSGHLDKAKALLIGPGLGQCQWAKALFTCVISNDKPVVIDADGLHLLNAYMPNGVAKGTNNQWVLTPHPKEAATLLNTSVANIEANRFDAVVKIAKKYRCICVLKGAGSLVSDGNQTWVNTSGNHGMATGGMGDVLAGVIAATSMQTKNLFEATRLAVYLHGKAGDNIAAKQGHIGLLASDLFEQFPRLLKSVYEPISSDIS